MEEGTQCSKHCGQGQVQNFVYFRGCRMYGVSFVLVIVQMSFVVWGTPAAMKCTPCGVEY